MPVSNHNIYAFTRITKQCYQHAISFSKLRDFTPRIIWKLVRYPAQSIVMSQHAQVNSHITRTIYGIYVYCRERSEMALRNCKTNTWARQKGHNMLFEALKGNLVRGSKTRAFQVTE